VEYGITIKTAGPFAETVAKVRDALREQGFGVLTEIDVRATMQDKLGAAMEDYIILGACNPPLAHRALSADRSIGLLLPCNVVVRAGNGETVVEAMNPLVMTQVTGEPALAGVAEEAAARLRTALAEIG
jgi:uncharacterized protein (DUF302 family)